MLTRHARPIHIGMHYTIILTERQQEHDLALCRFLEVCCYTECCYTPVGLLDDDGGDGLFDYGCAGCGGDDDGNDGDVGDGDDVMLVMMMMMVMMW